MDCWVRVPSVGRALGRISSGGTHESVHRSKSAFQRLLYSPPPNKKLFSLVRDLPCRGNGLLVQILDHLSLNH